MLEDVEIWAAAEEGGICMGERGGYVKMVEVGRSRGAWTAEKFKSSCQSSPHTQSLRGNLDASIYFPSLSHLGELSSITTIVTDIQPRHTFTDQHHGLRD
jgi:hypothetical protein